MLQIYSLYLIITATIIFYLQIKYLINYIKDILQFIHCAINILQLPYVSPCSTYLFWIIWYNNIQSQSYFFICSIYIAIQIYKKFFNRNRPIQPFNQLSATKNVVQHSIFYDFYENLLPLHSNKSSGRFVIDYHHLLMFIKIFRLISPQNPYVIDFQAVQLSA